MKIAVIGEGIVGYAVASYLADNQNIVDCISPDINFQKSSKEPNKELLINNNKLISPKLKRKDFVKNRIESEKIFKKECSHFEGIEMANKMGLAKFWGANLAYNGLKKDIDSLKLTKKEWNFIKRIIPFFDVQNFYNEKFNWVQNNNLLKKQEVIQSSILAIYENLIQDDSLPGFESSKAIFGNFPIEKTKFNRIDGKVIKIQIDKKESISTSIFIRNQENIFKKEYDYVVITSGAIGSYRLVMQSFQKNRNKKIFDKIKHHHIFSTLTFIPKLPYPKKYIGMSNFDMSLKLKNLKLYINFFPFRSLIDVKNYQLKKIYKKSFLIKLQVFLLKIFNEYLINFYFAKWIIHRLYISNIYLPSEITSSYIGNDDKKVYLFGGLRSDYEKYFLRKFWIKLNNKLKIFGVFNLLKKPKSISIGADLHYSSTLSNYVRKNGTLKINGIPKNILVVDSSSSNYLPISNPTLFFVARAIKLVRKIKKNNDK